MEKNMTRIVTVIVFALMVFSGCVLQSDPQPTKGTPLQVASPPPEDESIDKFPTAFSTSTPTDMETKNEIGALLTRMKLSQALLRLEDIPAGWTEYSRDGDEQDSGEAHRFLCRTLAREAIEMVVVEFRVSQLGPILVHTIQTFPVEIVEEQLKIREDAIFECGQFETEGEVELKWTVAPVDFPKFGERSAAMRATAKFGSSKLEIESVYFVVGDTLSNIQHIQVGGGRPNRQFTLEMARIASERVIELVTFK